MMDARRLEAELRDLPDGWIVLLETTTEKSLELSLASIRILTEKGYRGLILSANRPYRNLMGLYEKSGIAKERVFVIDCVSGRRDTPPEDAGRVVYIDGVNSLTAISYTMNQTMDRTEGKRFVFIDSITTMLMHNNHETYARFVHILLTKMRLAGINGLLVSLETETSRDIRAEIGQLCDKIIRL
jgi:hypothetical protein